MSAEVTRMYQSCYTCLATRHDPTSHRAAIAKFINRMSTELEKYIQYCLHTQLSGCPNMVFFLYQLAMASFRALVLPTFTFLRSLTFTFSPKLSDDNVALRRQTASYLIFSQQASPSLSHTNPSRENHVSLDT